MPTTRQAVVRAVIAVSALVVLVPPESASAGLRAPTRLVTFVARQCPTYADIAANRARNNIQESLEDLGADSLYNAGDAVSASIEALQQPNCTPITDWRFVMGTGILGREVVGPWGALSIVTDPYSTSIVTQPSVPLLDRSGHDTGQEIAGAVTITLTDAQSQRASTSSSLWTQGGTPSDPVLDQVYPGGFGFGALRCAIDILNGDNVEWIAYPSGAKHVFCFAYYVVPPPTSGTIVVRKAVDDPAATAKQTFTFQGNVSYTEDQRFTLSASATTPGSVTFYRAAGETWSWRELDLPGWSRVGLSCQSATGASQTATDVASGSASVTLAAGDTVTCTHTNRPTPPPAGLVLSKRTLGGIGTFRFRVRGPDTRSQAITTQEEDTPVAGEPLTLAPGDYRIGERGPAPSPAGEWTLESATCGGQPVDITEPIALSLAPGAGKACEFTNRFTPRGSITLRKRTEGAAGSVGFVIHPVDDPVRVYEQRATTNAAGATATATGDATDALALGRYEIIETGPRPTPGGSWRLESVLCNGVPVGAAQGRIVVTLGTAVPDVECTFVNRFTAVPEPENPSDPSDPTVGGAGEAGDGPLADLRITKTASPTVARVGARVRYTIRVVNHGPGIAYDVVATEVNPHSNTPLSPRATKGRCTSARPARCVIGRLRPGESAMVTVDVDVRRAGRTRNRVAVVSSTTDPNLRNNRADAVVTAVRPAPPRFTG